MKKILFVASEAVPFIKTGGLADVAGTLPKYFDKENYDVRVILPKYLCNVIVAFVAKLSDLVYLRTFHYVIKDRFDLRKNYS